MLDTPKLPMRYANLSAAASRKLQHKHAGPFTLGRQYGENAFEFVYIPRVGRIHNPFSVSRFKRCKVQSITLVSSNHSRHSYLHDRDNNISTLKPYENTQGSTIKDLRYQVKWRATHKAQTRGCHVESQNNLTYRARIPRGPACAFIPGRLPLIRRIPTTGRRMKGEWRGMERLIFHLRGSYFRGRVVVV